MGTELQVIEMKMRMVRLADHIGNVPPELYASDGGLLLEKRDNRYVPLHRGFNPQQNQSILRYGENTWMIESMLMKAISAIEDSAYVETKYL
jgi:hypothetical protein